MKKTAMTAICLGSMFFSINLFAALTQNGFAANGVGINGTLNGLSLNGITLNGSINGLASNRFTLNGIRACHQLSQTTVAAR